MAKKRRNKNLAGALHFITGNCYQRVKVFRDQRYCRTFVQAVRELKQARPFKLIAYVLMVVKFQSLLSIAQ